MGQHFEVKGGDGGNADASVSILTGEASSGLNLNIYSSVRILTDAQASRQVPRLLSLPGSC